MKIDHSDFEIDLKPEAEDESECEGLSRCEQFESLEARLPSGVCKIGSVTDEVDNWRSWDCETHFYLIPVERGGFTYALVIISWDDNWEQYDIECVSRIKDNETKSEAKIALIEDWLESRSIDVSEGSPYLSLLNALRGGD